MKLCDYVSIVKLNVVDADVIQLCAMLSHEHHPIESPCCECMGEEVTNCKIATFTCCLCVVCVCVCTFRLKEFERDYYHVKIHRRFSSMLSLKQLFFVHHKLPFCVLLPTSTHFHALRNIFFALYFFAPARTIFFVLFFMRVTWFCIRFCII